MRCCAGKTKKALYVSFVWAVLLSTMLLLTACQKNVSKQENLPQAEQEAVETTVALNARVGIVPFTQPLVVGALLEGSLPREQGRITKEEMQKLDSMLEFALFNKQRYAVSLALPLSYSEAKFMASPAPTALRYWLEYGRAYGMDYIVVPQVITWHQRQGGRAGVSDSAHVRTEIFLLDIRYGRVFARSIFEEKQVGLLEDLSRVGTFFQRGGSWVTAEELSQEAITKAVLELRL